MVDGTWVVAYDNGRMCIEHLNGVPWHDAPLPKRQHRCKAQTRGFVNSQWVFRCACGSISIDRHYWFDRNSRKKGKK